jgi:hypothetical protein
MADMSLLGGSDNAVTFMVSAGLVYEIIAAACSSPQTTEINASTRADTLMKWVKIGLIQAAIFVAIAVYLDKDRWPAAFGGALAALMMWLSYAHAKESGLRNGGPSTEDTMGPGPITFR